MRGQQRKEVCVMSKENAEEIYALFQLHQTIANRMAEMGVDAQSENDTEVIAKVATAVGMPCTAEELAEAGLGGGQENNEQVIHFQIS